MTSFPSGVRVSLHGLRTTQENDTGIQGEYDRQECRWCDDSTLEYSCGGGECLDERNYFVKFVLHGGDMQDKCDDVSARGPARHAQISCKLRNFGVPEVQAFRWRERDDFKYLAVGPACGSLFSSAKTASVKYSKEANLKKERTLRGCFNSLRAVWGSKGLGSPPLRSVFGSSEEQSFSTSMPTSFASLFANAHGSSF
jgi:hypothetical protein